MAMDKTKPQACRYGLMGKSGLAAPGASSLDRIFDLYDISGKRIGRVTAREFANVNVAAKKLTLIRPGVIIAASRDGVERRILRIK